MSLNKIPSNLKCVRCNTDLQSGKNCVLWNPKGWLCNACQKDWTELFFKMNLDKDQSSGRIQKINGIWQNFIGFFNPSVRFLDSSDEH